MFLIKLLTYPIRKTSDSFKNAELMRIGNGNRSNKAGNFTIASHCSPTFDARKPSFKFKEWMKYKR